MICVWRWLCWTFRSQLDLWYLQLWIQIPPVVTAASTRVILVDYYKWTRLELIAKFQKWHTIIVAGPKVIDRVHELVRVYIEHGKLLAFGLGYGQLWKVSQKYSFSLSRNKKYIKTIIRQRLILPQIVIDRTIQHLFSSRNRWTKNTLT